MNIYQGIHHMSLVNFIRIYPQMRVLLSPLTFMIYLFQFRWLTTIERGKMGGIYAYMTPVWAIWSLRSGCIVPNAIPRGDEICREHKC